MAKGNDQLLTSNFPLFNRFCVASSVGFVLEVIHNIDDLSRKPKIAFLSQSLTNFTVIVFTDLPLIVLNLIITACHGKL